MIANLVILALVTLQRFGELILSKRNTERLLSQGAREYAPGHYPWIVAVHVAWLATLWWFAPAGPIVAFWLVLFVFIEIGRVWMLVSLGGRWTTRIIVPPTASLVRNGPYRFVDHPNYLIVMAEIAVLPLVFGLWKVALVFSLLNAAVLSIRIREENRALGRTQRG